MKKNCVVIGAGIFALALWMTVEAVIAFFNIPAVIPPRSEVEGPEFQVPSS